MTAAHLILVWEQQDDPNLLRHAARARDVGRNPRIVGYKADYGPVRVVLRVDRRRAAGARRAGAVVATVHETVQVRGIRCERCMARLGHVLKGHDGLESANATLTGEVMLVWTTHKRRGTPCSPRSRAAASASSSRHSNAGRARESPLRRRR